MRFSHLLAGAASASIAGLALAQSAVLHNGTVVTLKAPLETFSIEGPMWNIDVANRQLISTGYRITIPSTLNGVEFVLGNTQIVNGEEVSLGPITAETFSNLTDANAVNRDAIVDTAGEAGTIRFGPARSLYSTSEARGAIATGLDRSPQIEKAIEDTYFFLVRNAFAMYPAGTLPVDFLGRIGIRTETGAFANPNGTPPARRFWRYPSSTGATVLGQGSVYVDAAGNEYNIPDFPIKGFLAHVLIAENVCIGNLKAAAIGNPNTPDSFVIGTTLVLMNQDPRMPLDIIGLAGSPVSKEYFSQAALPGSFIAVVGHMIGEHVMFAEVVEAADLFDPAVGGWVTVVERTWGFNPGRGLSFRGDVVPIAGNTLTYQYGLNDVFTGPVISLNPILIVDPLLNTARFDVRDQPTADPVLRRQIKFTLRETGSGVIIRETVFNWADILGL